MPPRPLSIVRPNVGFSLTATGFDQRPDVAQGIAQCIAYWSWVETQMGRLFVIMLGTNERAGTDLYISFESATAKNAALRTLAISRLPQEDHALINALLRLLKAKQKIRDKIAHWFWGLPTELPDSMVLVDPKHLWRQSAKFAEGLVKSAADARIQPSDVQAYSAKELQEDAEDFRQLALLVNEFHKLCFFALKGAEHDQLRASLTSDGRLAQYLSPIQLGDQ